MAHVTCQSFRTPTFKVGDSLIDFIVANISREVVGEGSVVAITSKIVSLAEHRLCARHMRSKPELIHAEADRDLGPIAHGSQLTIKHGLFVIASGIDESNSVDGDYILYPLDPWTTAQTLWRELRGRWHLDRFGVMLTDSRTTPLRRGVSGVSLSHYGFRGVNSFVGQQDLFGRPLKMTKANVADALANAAVLTMGEADEARPLALLSSSEIMFFDGTDREDLIVTPEDDLYGPIYPHSR